MTNGLRLRRWGISMTACWPALLCCGLLWLNPTRGEDVPGEKPAEAAEKKEEAPSLMPGQDVPLEMDQSVEKLAELGKKSVVVITVEGRDGRQQGLGSGFIIDPEGLIATNQHVIGEGREISVQLSDGRKFPVTVVHATQRAADLAIIKIDQSGLPALPLGDASELKQGQAVVALGNPHGLKHSVVSGVVSGQREIDGRQMIQLAMPIEPGNSGGPLLDMQGRVQGIITMKSLVTNNLGFAVQVNALQPLIDKPNPVPMTRWLTIGALDPADWTPLFGARWRQHSGHIHVDGLGKGFGGRSLCLSKLDVPETPYDVQVQVKLDDEGGAAGLVFHSDGADHHYGFYPSARKLRLSRFDGADVYAWNVLLEKPHAAYRPKEWNTIKVHFEADKIQCFINDEPVIEWQGEFLGKGRVGLAKFRETVAEFKNFRVSKELPRATPTVEQRQRIELAVADIPPSGPLSADLVETLQAENGAELRVLRDQARRLELQAEQLRKLARRTHEARICEQLVELMQQPEGEIDLTRAALLIAQLDNDDLDPQPYMDELDRMGKELRESLPENADAEAKRLALNKLLFEELGFHGSRGDYYNRSNSYLNEVLDDREGLPITLSIIYLELGRRIGLDLVGIGLPTHFVVEAQPAQKPRQFIDVFEGGVLMSELQADELVFKNTDRHVHEEQLVPVNKKAIVLRMLGNLMGLANDSEDAVSLLRYVEAHVAVDPESARERWFRAVLRYQLGQLTEAKADVDWLLLKAPEKIDLVRVRELGELIERQLHEE